MYPCAGVTHIHTAHPYTPGLPSTLLVAQTTHAINMARPILEQHGSAVVPLRCHSSLCKTHATSLHVFVHTTEKLYSIPPGMQVLYLLDDPAHAVLASLTPQNTQGSPQHVLNCAVQSQAAHLRHWQHLTRAWPGSMVVVRIKQLCDGAANELVWGMAGGICSQDVYRQITRMAEQAKQDVAGLGGGKLTLLLEDMAINGYNLATNTEMQGLPCVPTQTQAARANLTPFFEYSTMAFPQAKGGLDWVARRRIHLIFTFFPALEPSRNAELEQSLHANLNNPYVDMLHIFIDGNTKAEAVPLPKRYIGKRVQLIYQEQQPTYADLVMYANAHLPGQIAIVMNGDCVFTDTVQLFHQMPSDNVYGLSRRQSQEVAYANCEDDSVSYKDQCRHYTGSHDAFGFVPPLAVSLVDDLHYHQNLWGADPLTISVFKRAKFTVLNPCFDIVLLHNHCSNWRGGVKQHKRTQNDTIGYAEQPPTNLSATHLHWLYSVEQQLFVQIS